MSEHTNSLSPAQTLSPAAAPTTASPVATSCIAAIIPTRKGHATIARAVQSILDQTLQAAEIIIVSDHKHDIPADKEAADLLSSVLNAHFPDEMRSGKIRIIQGKAEGPGTARNLGVQDSASMSSLIAFLDDDDIWADPNKLEKQAAYLAAHSDIDVVGTETTFFIDENGKRFKTITQPTDPIAVRRQMLSRNPLITSSVLMKKSAFKEFGGFKRMYLAEEYELWLRINRKRNRLSNVADTFIEYTVRPGSASQSKKIRMAWAVFILVFKNLLFYPNRFGMVKAKWPVFKRLLTEKLR